MAGPVLLLGPQRPHPNLPAALAAHGIRGPVAVLTAGWRHDEPGVEALARAIPNPLVHLPIYRWFDEILAEAPGFQAAYSARQERIRAYKLAYQDQLRCHMQQVSRMQARAAADPVLYGPELDYAVHQLEKLDERALERMNALRDAHPEAAAPWDAPAVRLRHDELKRALGGCEAVLIAGGHVGVLRNRLYTFGLDALLPAYLAHGGAVVGWSAGAMALAERIYLYYDDPPEGPAETEILDTGLGVAPGLVALPHARLRLRFDDPVRMARLGRRLGPLTGVAMENGAWFEHSARGGAEAWRDHSAPGTAWRVLPDGPPAPLSDAGLMGLGAPPRSLGPRTVTP
jgi:hypothetical protein